MNAYSLDACSHLTMNLSRNHEEAYTRLFVHVLHAIKHSNQNRFCSFKWHWHCCDSCSPVAVFADLQQDGLQKLWVAFGQSNKRKWMPIHTLFENLAKRKAGHFCSSKHSVVVMFSGLREKARRCSKRGLIFQKQHRLLWSPAVNHKWWTPKILMRWKSSLWCSTTDPVLNQMLIQLDALYSLRSINLMIRYRQPGRAALFQHVLRAAVVYQAGYVWG